MRSVAEINRALAQIEAVATEHGSLDRLLHAAGVDPSTIRNLARRTTSGAREAIGETTAYEDLASAEARLRESIFVTGVALGLVLAQSETEPEDVV